MRTRPTEDDPYPDYERRLDALEATERRERWRRWLFWGLSIPVLVGGLWLLQTLSRPMPVAPGPAPVASVPRPAPAPQPTSQVRPVQAKQGRPPGASATELTPAQDQAFCHTVGMVAGVTAWGRNYGTSITQALEGAATDPSPDAVNVMQEIIAYVYTHMDMTPDDVHEVWQRECHARLGRQTPSGAIMRRFRQFQLAEEARLGLTPSAGGTR